MFLPPAERGKKIENFFSPENERSHQYASNEVQTIVIGHFLVAQLAFMCFFDSMHFTGLLLRRCAIIKPVAHLILFKISFFRVQ